MQRSGRLWNFAAGPAALPDSVLLEIQKELLNFGGCGRSVMELSHRSKVFEDVLDKAERDLRALLSIPPNYKVLFFQGGGTAQFAAIPLNLLGEAKAADYVITGSWSKKASEEAKKYCTPQIVASGSKAGKFVGIPPVSEWRLDPKAAYLYYCTNETVDGVEFQETPSVGEGVLLVADASSDFLSREIDVSKHAVIYAGAQKNCGIAGVTIVIVREDLLNRSLPITPTALDFKIFSDNKSLYNTPPTFSIYIAGLMFQWILDQGGIKGIEKMNIEKSERIYSVVDSSDFYRPCVEKPFRSRMNVTLRLKDEKLEPVFLKEAGERGLIELAGHRSVGGIRISLYNAIPMEAVNELADFMTQFAEKYKGN